MRWAALMLAVFAWSPAMGLADEFSDILDDGKAHVLIDQLSSEDRQQAIRELAARLERDTGRTGQILCAIRPWTTGTAEADAALQADAWTLMTREENAESEVFRWLDCAAANRDGWYRATTLNPMFNLRQAYCAGLTEQRATGLDVRAIAEGIRSFNVDLNAGILTAFGDQRQTLHSFYPVRNALRIATLQASDAVRLWTVDEDAARMTLREASASLNAALEQLDVTSTRNGWRLYNDLEFHAAFYSWLADGDEDEARLRAFLDPQPVLDDPRLVPAVTPEIRERMPGDFVDMIYVERLLPGAQLLRQMPSSSSEPLALDSEECAQWHRRSYNPAALAEAVLDCAEVREDIVEFDTCMRPFEATDWTLQYASLSDRSGSTVEGERTRISGWITDRLSSFSQSDADDLRDLLLPIQIERTGSTVVFVAPATFTTSQRERLEAVFDQEGGLDPLFMRPRAY